MTSRDFVLPHPREARKTATNLLALAINATASNEMLRDYSSYGRDLTMAARANRITERLLATGELPATW